MTLVGFITRQFDSRIYDLDHYAIQLVLRKRGLEEYLSATQCSLFFFTNKVYRMTATNASYFTALLWVFIDDYVFFSSFF